MRPAPETPPVATVCRGHPEKMDAAAALFRVDLSVIMSPELRDSAHPDKAGHPGAGFLSLMAGSGGGNRDLSALGRASPLKSATQSSGRLPQGVRVFACEAIRLDTTCDQQ